MGDVDTRDEFNQIPVHATRLRCASTLTQAFSLTLSGCSVQVNRVLTYHDLDKDLMKYAAFQTLVSGCCYGVTDVTPSPPGLPSFSIVLPSCVKYTALSSKQLPVCFQVCSSLAVWLSCLFVSVNSMGMVSAAQRLRLLSWTKYVSLMRQILCLSLARPTWRNDGLLFLAVCKTVTVCVHRMERLT